MSVIRVTLPDGSTRELDKPTSIIELAAQIGPGLAKATVAGKVDGELRDLRTVLDKDCKLTIVTNKDPEALEVVRHSAAHIMAQAVQNKWPEIKITIGPVIENGFFYDLDSPRTFNPEELQVIEKEMAKIVKADFEIKKEVWPIEKAIETFKKMGERFKVEIIEDLAKKEGNKEVSIYHQGPWFDLCRGPHLQRTSQLKAFKLMSIAGAYWRGNENNPMLQRIYGTAFNNKKELDEYLHRLEEAKKRDHRKLGKEMGLFMFHKWAPASPFFLPKGATVYNELIQFIKELYFKYGYQEVITPQIMDVETYQCSGHYDNYRDNMYFTVPADEEASKESHEKQSMLKAMNCPGHALMYKSQLRSYRDLPWRVADFGRLHRFERAGVVHGLARVRTFAQDDAHIFCTVDQVQDEITAFMNLLSEVYRVMGFQKYKVYFSTRPEKRVGDDEIWDKAEGALEAAIKNLNLDYEINEGDGAFYGPKLDIMVTDAIGRAWQLGTIQCDFNMAQRFELEYTGEDNKAHRPVVLHRAVLGSVERFFAVMTEHVAGHYPPWLAPIQARLININEAQLSHCEKIVEKMRAKGLRVEADLRNEKLGFKIREAQLQKIPYMLIFGDQELANNTVSVRRSQGKEEKGVPIDTFIEKLLRQVQDRALEME